MRYSFHITALAAAFLLQACGGHDAVQNQSSSYKTIRVGKGNGVIESKYSASLEGQQVVEIRPQISGTITRICIEEGAGVKQGEILFVIDQVPYKAAVEMAEAAVKNTEAVKATAELTMQSNQILYDQDIISTYELQTAKNSYAAADAALAQANAQLTTARNNLSYTEVRSPLNGVAGMIPFKVGALVSANSPTALVSVSDDSYISAYFSLSEKQILSLQMQFGSLEAMLDNMKHVKLIMSNGEVYAKEGEVDAISGIIDSRTGSVRLRARFENNDHLLKSGGSGTVIIPTIKKDCLLIPQSATYEIQEKIFVYKVVEGKAVSQEVKVFKLNNGSNYIVESGLEEGDTIIAEGAGLIKEGTRINVSEK